MITFQDRLENSNLHMVTLIFCLLVLGTGLGTKKAVRFTEYYSKADYRGECCITLPTSTDIHLSDVYFAIVCTQVKYET